MREIGGYFELELSLGEEYHKDAIKLNSGRNAFEYILKAQSISKVFIPNYICNSILEPLKKLEVDYEFYNIDKKFEIIEKIKLKKGEKLFYVNYFALKSKYINLLVNQYKNSLIVDNTQAFFETPVVGIDTLYSPRKFFGVPDGGYLYTNIKNEEKIKENLEIPKISHLIGRLNNTAEEYYHDYLQSESRLSNGSIKRMSNFTMKILSSIDYRYVVQIRRNNYLFLKENLNGLKELNFDGSNSFIPFVYLYKTNNLQLRKRLINEKIYVAQYWIEVLSRESVNSLEKSLVVDVIPLPIDQRYTIVDMKRIIKCIEE